MDSHCPCEHIVFPSSEGIPGSLCCLRHDAVDILSLSPVTQLFWWPLGEGKDTE